MSDLKPATVRLHARRAQMTPEQLIADRDARRAANRRSYEKHKADRVKRVTDRRDALVSQNPEAWREKERKREVVYEVRNGEKIRSRRGMVFKPGQTLAGMREEQNGLCACCKEPLPTGKLCHVDHCHTTGQVRALLCHHCNTGIGFFDDSPELLKAAADYLEAHAARIEKAV